MPIQSLSYYQHFSLDDLLSEKKYHSKSVRFIVKTALRLEFQDNYPPMLFRRNLPTVLKHLKLTVSIFLM